MLALVMGFSRAMVAILFDLDGCSKLVSGLLTLVL